MRNRKCLIMADVDADRYCVTECVSASIRRQRQMCIRDRSKNVAFEKDGWTVRTKDRKPSAHFEHCIAIRPDGPQILSSFKFLEEVLGENAI